jgi:acyl carrier protein
MTSDEAFALLVAGLEETFGLDRTRITREARLSEDLDLDSIDAVDLAVKLQKATGARIAPEVFKRVRTVGDVVDALAALPGK